MSDQDQINPPAAEPLPYDQLPSDQEIVDMDDDKDIDDDEEEDDDDDDTEDGEDDDED